MINASCYRAKQNDTSNMAQVTTRVTPENSCHACMNASVLIDCYLVTSKNRGIHGKIYSYICVRTRVYACIYTHL